MPERKEARREPRPEPEKEMDQETGEADAVALGARFENGMRTTLDAIAAHEQYLDERLKEGLAKAGIAGNSAAYKEARRAIEADKRLLDAPRAKYEAAAKRLARVTTMLAASDARTAEQATMLQEVLEGLDRAA